ncbi:MAG: hypothetical protein JNK26_01695 [Candidatus Doudnabacteria bacterium]|nr:hypothetical protein [Candidatus Doudnabacteria bacterium]
MPIKYTSYKITPVGSSEIFTDFAHELKIPRKILPLVLGDLYKLGTDKREVFSELVFDWQGQQIKLVRGTEPSFFPPLAGDMVQEVNKWRNTFVLVPPHSNPGDKEQLKYLVEARLTAAANPELEELAKKIESQGEQGKKILELNRKTETIEMELSAQKQRDEAVMTLGDLEAAFAQTEEKIKSVQDLVAKQGQISQTLGRYGELLNHDLDAKAAQLRQQLAQLRHQELLESIKSTKFIDPVKASKNTDSELVDKPLVSRFLLALSGILVLAGIGGFLLTGVEVLVVVSSLLGILELILFAAINYFPPTVDLENVKVLRKEPEPLGGKTASPDKPQVGVLSSIERFFVDKAWIGALRNELEHISLNVQTRLEGRDVSELQNEYNNLKQNIENLKIKIEKYKKMEIEPQEYLSKRRELDTLSLDRARLERELRTAAPDLLETVAKYDELRAAAGGRSWQLPAELSAAVGIVAFVASDTGLVVKTVGGGEVSFDTLAPDVVYGLLVLLKLEEWEASQHDPVVIVDHLTSVAEPIKVILMQRLSALNALGQIVLISTLP